MFKPKQDFILVKPIERKASNVIATVLRELPNLGEVMAVGPGKRHPKTGRLQPLDVKVGDIVRFGEFRNMFPEYRETPESPAMLIMQEADLAGIVEREDLAA